MTDFELLDAAVDAVIEKTDQLGAREDWPFIVVEAVLNAVREIAPERIDAIIQTNWMEEA